MRCPALFSSGTVLFAKGSPPGPRHLKAASLWLCCATELAPNLAPALAYLALAHIVDAMSAWTSSPFQSLDQADEAAQRAKALNERYPYASTAQAVVAEVYVTLRNVLHYVGRSDEALGYFDRAMALDPYCLDMWLHFKEQSAFQLGR